MPFEVKIKAPSNFSEIVNGHYNVKRAHQTMTEGILTITFQFNLFSNVVFMSMETIGRQVGDLTELRESFTPHKQDKS